MLWPPFVVEPPKGERSSYEILEINSHSRASSPDFISKLKIKIKTAVSFFETLTKLVLYSNGSHASKISQ
jgi:hypothetical protein